MLFEIYFQGLQLSLSKFLNQNTYEGFMSPQNGGIHNLRIENLCHSNGIFVLICKSYYMEENVESSEVWVLVSYVNVCLL
jgi:hypothetical protein